jgi:co-chaperonin GroES (HSP10)
VSELALNSRPEEALRLQTEFIAKRNTSGFIPYDTRLIVLPDKVEDTFANSSLLRPDQDKEKQKYAQTRGTLIAVGENAFADWGSAAKPKAGDRVVYGRYAGNQHVGADGKEYTVCNDEDILAGWSGD